MALERLTSLLRLSGPLELTVARMMWKVLRVLKFAMMEVKGYSLHSMSWEAQSGRWGL